MRMIENWYRFHREVMEFPLLELSKSQLGMAQEKPALDDLALHGGIELDNLHRCLWTSTGLCLKIVHSFSRNDTCKLLRFILIFNCPLGRTNNL